MTKLKLIFIFLSLTLMVYDMFLMVPEKSYGDDNSSTISFVDVNKGSTPSEIKGAAILGKNNKIIRLEVTPIEFPQEGGVTSVFIKFSNKYEARMAVAFLKAERLRLQTTYYTVPISSRFGSRKVQFVNRDGSGPVPAGQPAMGVVLRSENVLVHRGNLKYVMSFDNLAESQIRDDELNKGTYSLDLWAQIRKFKDWRLCQGKFFESSSCPQNQYSR